MLQSRQIMETKNKILARRENSKLWGAYQRGNVLGTRSEKCTHIHANQTLIEYLLESRWMMRNVHQSCPYRPVSRRPHGPMRMIRPTRTMAYLGTIDPAYALRREWSTQVLPSSAVH